MKDMERALHRQKYLTDPTKCPYCTGTSFETGQLEMGAGFITQDIECVNCNKTWTDIYHFVDVELN